LPGLQSQSPTDFDLATWASGVQASYGLTDWLQLGGRFVYSQADAVVDDYSTTTAVQGDLNGRLFVDLSAWRTEAIAQIQLLDGFTLKPRLTLAGGYTWTIYNNPTLQTDDQFAVVLDSQASDFATGAWTTTGTLDISWRPLTFLEVSFGAELSRYFGGLYQTAFRFPIAIHGVFWGPI
jgi:hypothetical protein